MADHKKPLQLATAELMRIISTMQEYQAALIADDHALADDLRSQAHHMLDSYLDHSGEAALAVRALLPR